MNPKPITIVGCGPGSLEYVTPAALRAIREARVLVGATRLLEAFPESSAARIAVGADIPGVLEKMAERIANGERVTVLVTGDPGLCSLATPVLRRFSSDACRVIAGVSSVQAAFAAIGADWLDARILSAHDNVPEAAPETFAAEEKLAVLAGNPASAGWVEALARTLLATHHLFLCENLTLENESIRRIEARNFPLQPASRSLFLFLKKQTHTLNP